MPVFLNYNSHFGFSEDLLAGYGHDPFPRIWSIWWYEYAIIDLGVSPFSTEGYTRHPASVPFNSDIPFNSIVGIPLHLIWNSAGVYEFLLFSTFVLNGYGIFLLANHLTKNRFASILAGVLFSYSIYSAGIHGQGHLGLNTLYWIPFFTLFLLKSRSNNSYTNPIFAGVFLFFIFLSQYYLIFYVLLFLLVVIPYLFIVSKTKRKFSIRLGIIFLIFFSLAIPFFYFSAYQTISANEPNLIFPRSEQVLYSVDVMNLIKGPANSVFNTISNNPFVMHISFNHAENWAFFGYVGLFFSIFAILRVKKTKTLPWIIGGGFLLLISFGPFLKINGINTGIPMPWELIRELPYADIFRAPARAHIMFFFAFSILASLGISQILSNKWFTRKKVWLFFSIIFILIALELYPNFGGIPIPEMPEIYTEIKNDPRKIAVLDGPLGGGGSTSLGESGWFQYYQSFHEKPMIAVGGGGRSSPVDVLLYPQQYFLEEFTYPSHNGTIVNQNLSEVGISLLNYFNVGYVIIHKNPIGISTKDSETFVNDSRDLLYEIFEKEPDYEDSVLFAYKVPDNKSKSAFIVLNDEWSTLIGTSNILYRTIPVDSYLTIVNPNDTLIQASLKLEVVSWVDNKVLLNFNDEESFLVELEANKPLLISSPILNLSPGTNQLRIISQLGIEYPPELWFHKSLTVGLAVKEISIDFEKNDLKDWSYKVLDKQVYNVKEVEAKITELYLEILQRFPDASGMKTYKNYIIEEEKSYDWLRNILINSEEYKNKFK